MQRVVDTAHLMASGVFQLYPNEIMRNPVNSNQSLRACCPYINSNAQDRLITVLNSHAPVFKLMGQFSDWIQHLYACEVLSIQGQVHAGPGPVGVYEVDPWPAPTQ